MTKMTGTKDLSELLKAMAPKVRERDLVFCTIPWEDIPDTTIDPLCLFKEEEGFSLILTKKQADSLGLNYDGVWTRIELMVHSDLMAIGFLSAVSKALADGEISVNVVSAHFHDHLFVPSDQAKKAIKLLEQLSKDLP